MTTSKTSLLARLLALAFAVRLATPALARLNCKKEPKAKWKSDPDMKARIAK